MYRVVHKTISPLRVLAIFLPKLINQNWQALKAAHIYISWPGFT